MKFIELQGAHVDGDWDSREFTKRGKVSVDFEKVFAYYDHSIMMEGRTIYVMETKEEIDKKLQDA